MSVRPSPQDVLSVAFSVDNRQIVSGSRDKTIKLWNTLGECKYTIQAWAPYPYTPYTPYTGPFPFQR